MQSNDPDEASAAGAGTEHDAYASIRLTNFRWYWVGNIVAVLGMQMQAITAVWEVYKRTGNPFNVGLVGLVQVIPVLSLALLAGHAADRFDRKKVMMCAAGLSGTASLGLAAVSFFQWHIGIMFFFLFFVGVARAFQIPAKSSFLPQLIPRKIFSNAVTWRLGGFQLAAVAGPALGGWLLALSGHAYVVYLLQVCATLTFIALLSRVKRYTATAPHEAATLKSLQEGIAFVWKNKVILGAMSLDMFAVLLGGATALLPVFAKDILAIGPVGYGWLASAPAVGALVMSLTLMHRRPIAQAGQALLWAVAGFGAAIVVFGFSKLFVLSFGALLLTGAFDCISVVVRHTMVQMQTPDRMRGRVSAISGMFIGASNELGEFESGLVASLTTPIFAVVSGGFGTLLVVVIAALAIPELRRYGRLDGRDRRPAAPEPVAVAEDPAEVFLSAQPGPSSFQRP